MLPADSDTFMVEKIKKHRIRNGKQEFFIKWQGYPNKDNTWEPTSHLNAELINHYFSQQNNSTKESKDGNKTNAEGTTCTTTGLSHTERSNYKEVHPLLTWVLRILLLFSFLALAKAKSLNL